MSYQPPFDISSKMIHQISAISEQLGRLETQQVSASPQLRKQNRIRTIQGTLAIEGNRLSVEQVSEILEGKRVLGQPREIQEVQGAIRAYEALPNWNPTAINDLLAAHSLLMADILVNAGKFRKGGVGIQKGSQVVHMAPPAKRVPLLMADLMSWVKNAPDHALIKSCVFHYELEFIHPFMDGNGRMGRLWQTALLGAWNKLFYLLPIESVIKDQQARYYKALEDADKAANSTVFVEFMLDIIYDAIAQNPTKIDQRIQPEPDQVGDQVGDQVSDQVSDQVKELLAVMGDRDYTSQELMTRLSLSRKPTFRKNYLNPAIAAGLVVMKYPQSPRSPKQTYKKR
jgi:Fic family protein